MRDVTGATHEEEIDALTDLIRDLQGDARRWKAACEAYLRAEETQWKPLLAAANRIPGVYSDSAHKALYDAIAACEEKTGE